MFILNDDGQLLRVAQESYDSEDLLQRLLADYPSLIPGEQINAGSPRKWLLVTREASLPDEEGGSGRWSVDHLFLDQDGIPTLVEVKRASDTRLRREVVGQMLDYAANAVVYWPVERIKSLFEAKCEREGKEADQALVDFLEGEDSPEEFWLKVKTNLQAEKVRLLFVADKIPRELRRIIEYLNGQMDPTEVLGLEISQFVGQGIKALVPKLMGQTAEAEGKKATLARQGRKWDADSFFSLLASKQDPAVVEVAHKLLGWAQRRNLDIWWGEGSTMGSYLVRCGANDDKNSLQFMFSVWSHGGIEIPFQYMLKRSPFDSTKKREELRKRLNEIDGLDIPADSLSRRPSIMLNSLTIKESYQKFVAVYEWFIEQHRSSQGPDYNG